MSYSINIQTKTKDEAKARIAEKLATIVEQQKVHARDQPAIQANANACIDLLADDDSKDVSVSLHGSVSWNTPAGPDDYPTVPLTSASISCGATLVARLNTDGVRVAEV